MGPALVCEEVGSVNIPVQNTLQQQAQKSRAASPAIVSVLLLWQVCLPCPADLGANRSGLEAEFCAWACLVSIWTFFMCGKASGSMQGTWGQAPPRWEVWEALASWTRTPVCRSCLPWPSPSKKNFHSRPDRCKEGQNIVLSNFVPDFFISFTAFLPQGYKEKRWHLRDG